MALQVGDLVKWFSHHDAFEASPIGVKGVQPVYKHGIILEVSAKKSTAIIVHCFDCDRRNLVILDVVEDAVHVLSETQE